LKSDPWQQWQAFAALFTPGATVPQAGSGRTNAFSSAPFADVAERFSAAARAYLDGATNASAPAPAEAARVFSDHLREIFADFQLPWSNAVGPSAGISSASPAFSLNSPALGASREHQQRWQRIADAWRRLDDAQRSLQRLGSDALREAAADFAARLGPAHPPAVSPEALRKLYDTWIDCAEDAYARAAHGESFCNALAEYVNASSECRRDLQAGIEHSAKLLDLPTRSEINTLNLRVKSLEEELRAARDIRKPKAAASKTRPTAAASKARTKRHKGKR
jgi:class III poly(R)-hydroxyalkanoic acid synthase PhaE subunit